MTPDPVLEGLIAAGVFTIAADRYEEETGAVGVEAVEAAQVVFVHGTPSQRETLTVHTHHLTRPALPSTTHTGHHQEYHPPTFCNAIDHTGQSKCRGWQHG